MRRALILGIFLGGMFVAGRGSARGDSLAVEFPKSPRFPVFSHGEDVSMLFSASREEFAREGSIAWSVTDYRGATIRHGKITLPAGEGSSQIPLTLKRLPSGYLEVRATVAGSGETLPARGSRRAGIATFGVLPELAALPLEHPDQSHFGIQGTNFIESGIFLQGNPYHPLYQTLGAHWVNAGRNWADAEPDHAGQYVAASASGKSSEADYIPREFLAPLNCVANLPWWSLEVPEGAALDRKDSSLRLSYPPADPSLYANYLRALAVNLEKQRAASYPALRENYYQIGWEPDWHWKGSDEDFVAMYQGVYRALHEGDPQAIVLGPGYGVTATGVKLLERLLPQGLAGALDGIAIHGYYIPFGNPKATSVEGKYVSPEEGGTIQSIRSVRELMARYLKPGAKLFQTEWGLDYRGRYSETPPEVLLRQAAYVVRGHIIFLGEGCDVTYFFYTADYGDLKKPGEDGYGLCFNLSMPKPSFGATRVSPKPVFMGACTLTRVLERAKSLGPVDLGPGLCAYAFDRDGETVAAVWSSDDAPHTVRIPVIKGSFVLDFMGNRLGLAADGRVAAVKCSMYPTYVFGFDFSQANLSQKPTHD